MRYVGWGAFAQAMFDKNPNTANAQSWRRERQELADLITSDEWEAARASTLNAHYTSEAVISGMWAALDHLGFAGGRVLEPAAGIGHFIGLTPEHLREDIAWTGVEIDPITGGIAKALYPGADIRVARLRDRRLAGRVLRPCHLQRAVRRLWGRRSRAIGRCPSTIISSCAASTRCAPAASLPSSPRAIRSTRKPTCARREIARRADFLGAIRLPGGKDGAFARNAGTDVTTDIIFLRRRAEGAAGDG